MIQINRLVPEVPILICLLSVVIGLAAWVAAAFALFVLRYGPILMRRTP